MARGRGGSAGGGGAARPLRRSVRASDAPAATAPPNAAAVIATHGATVPTEDPSGNGGPNRPPDAHVVGAATDRSPAGDTAANTSPPASLVDGDALAVAQGGGASIGGISDDSVSQPAVLLGRFASATPYFGSPPPRIPGTDLVLPPYTSPHSLMAPPGIGHVQSVMSLSDSNALFIQQSSPTLVGSFVPVPLGSAPEGSFRARLDVQAALVQRRNQGHYFGPITFIYKGETKLDLLLDPMALTEDEALRAARHRWSVERALELQFHGMTPLFGARLLATVIQQYLSPDLFQTLAGRLHGDNSPLIQDGVLLWLLCWNVLFPTKAVFNKAFTDHCGTLTMSRFQGDFPAFIRSFRRLLTIAVRNKLDSSESLLERFLTGCLECPRPIVQHHFRAVFISFLADPKSDQWNLNKLLDEAECLFSSAAAFRLPDTSFAQNSFSLAGIQSNDGVIALFTEALKAAVTATTGGGKSAPSKKRGKSKLSAYRGRYANLPKPTWMTEAPSDPNETRKFSEKDWNWCGSCARWTTCIAGHKNCAERGPLRKRPKSTPSTATATTTAAVATATNVPPAPAVVPLDTNKNPFGDITSLANHFAAQLRSSREAASKK